jgi:hypothetical protein
MATKGATMQAALTKPAACRRRETLVLIERQAIGLDVALSHRCLASSAISQDWAAQENLR